MKIKWHRDKHMLTVGTWIWAFVRIHCDDNGSNHYDDWTYYRQLVLHAYRLHLTVEWRMK